MNDDLRSKVIPGVVALEEGPGGLDVLVVTGAVADARIFLHGAQLSHWQPRGAEPVIFMSGKSVFEVGKAIRGGVPVCFPWFGPREGLPAHGFVRNVVWELEGVEQGSDGSVRVALATQSSGKTREKWPHDFVARLIYTVGAKLVMEFEVENTTGAAFTFSEALHTYFAVGDARRATVEGLDAAEYRDFPDRTKLLRQQGPVVFTEETDCVYVNTRAACVLTDPVMRRRIVVEKEGSDTTIVWNPWIAKSAAMADFGDDEWPAMVCIETGNAFENSVTLAAGARHKMIARISIGKSG